MGDTDDLVDAISTGLANKPALHELDDGETVKLRIGYSKIPPRDFEGATVEFHFGDTDTVEKITEIVEERVDKRKFKVATDKPKYRQGGNWTIGYVELNNEAEIVDYEIDGEYLKPTEDE